MDCEEIIGNAILGIVPKDLAASQIACKLAASRQIYCRICNAILDEQTTVVLELVKNNSTDHAFPALCFPCWEKNKGNVLSGIAGNETWKSGKFSLTLNTWRGPEKVTLESLGKDKVKLAKFETKEVEITFLNGHKEKHIADCAGGLALYLDYGKNEYSITHLASGKLVKRVKGKMNARRCVSELLPLTDWTQGQNLLVNDQELKAKVWRILCKYRM